MNLEDENSELRAHIKRWASDNPSGWTSQTSPPHAIVNDSYAKVYDSNGNHVCYRCGYSWPCPAEVAKGWEE